MRRHRRSCFCLFLVAALLGGTGDLAELGAQELLWSDVVLSVATIAEPERADQTLQAAYGPVVAGTERLGSGSVDSVRSWRNGSGEDILLIGDRYFVVDRQGDARPLPLPNGLLNNSCYYHGDSVVICYGNGRVTAARLSDREDLLWSTPIPDGMHDRNGMVSRDSIGLFLDTYRTFTYNTPVQGCVVITRWYLDLQTGASLGDPFEHGSDCAFSLSPSWPENSVGVAWGYAGRTERNEPDVFVRIDAAWRYRGSPIRYTDQALFRYSYSGKIEDRASPPPLKNGRKLERTLLGIREDLHETGQPDRILRTLEVVPPKPGTHIPLYPALTRGADGSSAVSWHVANSNAVVTVRGLEVAGRGVAYDAVTTLSLHRSMGMMQTSSGWLSIAMRVDTPQIGPLEGYVEFRGVYQGTLGGGDYDLGQLVTIPDFTWSPVDHDANAALDGAGIVVLDSAGLQSWAYHLFRMEGGGGPHHVASLTLKRRGRVECAYVGRERMVLVVHGTHLTILDSGKSYRQDVPLKWYTGFTTTDVASLDNGKWIRILTDKANRETIIELFDAEGELIRLNRIRNRRDAQLLVSIVGRQRLRLSSVHRYRSPGRCKTDSVPMR